MRRIVAAALLTIVLIGGREPAHAQLVPGGGAGAATAARGAAITPLGGYAIGSIAVAAAAPIIGTIILHRELTYSEVYHTTLSAFLGPVGWLIADRLFPPGWTPPGQRPPPRGRAAGGGGGGRNISMPRLGTTDFVPDEVLTEISGRASPAQIARMTRALRLTQLETHTFTLTGSTLQRWRIGAGRTVRGTLLAMRRYAIVTRGQPNWLFRGVQSQTAPAPPPQYVIGKLHLAEAHRITDGDDVLVAVIDSQIDTHHPDLAGAIAAEYNAVGTEAPPHPHGTGMAGAIAAHGKLTGVAPKVRLLAVHAFSASGQGAQGTTFAIIKGLDWAAGKNARIVNMSFAGPPDALMREMLAKAYQRGLVLIAAVGNSGPRSPPLYPAADPHVIGITATDADDKLLAVANRGRQVAVAAPGVDIIADAPEGKYQITTGTSVATAFASGVAALIVARDPKLSPLAVRQIMVRSARHIAGKRDDIGAGEIDALAAVEAIGKSAR